MEGSVKFRVVVRAKAESDMLAAARWYEEQNPGLGTEFLRAAETCVAAVARNPRSVQRYQAGTVSKIFLRSVLSSFG